MLDTALRAGILDAVPHPVWAVDEVGVIAFANPAAAHTLGYRSATELLGLPSHETLHHHRPDGSPYERAECPVLRPVRSAARPHVVDSAAEDQWFIRRDGTAFPITWSCAPVMLGDAPGLVLSFTDISAARERDRGRQAAEWAEITAAAPGAAVADGRAALVERMHRFIAENATDPTLDPAAVARAHHVSLRHLQVLFRDTGCTPANRIRDLRLRHARRCLENGESVTRAAIASGFTDTGTFTRAFRRRYGSTPSAFAASLGRAG